jgi:hypothetical protein
MGIFDDKQDDMSSLRTRYDELRQMEQNGEIDDSGREELQQLSYNFEDDM